MEGVGKGWINLHTQEKQTNKRDARSKEYQSSRSSPMQAFISPHWTTFPITLILVTLKEFNSNEIFILKINRFALGQRQLDIGADETGVSLFFDLQPLATIVFCTWNSRYNSPKLTM